MPQKGDQCCICLTKKSSRFTDTSKSEADVLQKCLGLSNTHERKLCDSCHRAVYKLKSDNTLLFSNFVHSKGKQHITNKSRHKQEGNRLAEWNKRTALETLPNNIILYILRFLSPKEYLAVQAVSTRFLDFCTDFNELLWLPVSKPISFQPHFEEFSTCKFVEGSILFLETTTSYTSRINEHLW